MTVRLLAKHKQYPIGSIVTLDAGTEAGLVAAKLADTNLAGGVPYVAPVVPNQRYTAQVEVDASSGSVAGIVNPKTGDVLPLGSGGADLIVTGTQAVGAVLTGAYSKGSGTFRFARRPTAGGALVPFGAELTSPNTYIGQISDRGFTIGAVPVTYLPPPAEGVAIPTVAPQAPTITGITAGDGAVTVTFTRNADAGGDVVTGDRVTVYNAATNVPIKSMDGTSPITVTGLTNGVSVYAKAATIGQTNGVGPFSAASSTASPSTAPADPNVYSTFSYEVATPITAGASRVTMLNSKRTSILLDNPAGNQQTFEFAVVNQPNNNRNVPSTGWVALPPGTRATITDTDAVKQTWLRVATASTKVIAGASCSGTLATFNVPSHGIPVNAKVLRSFGGNTPKDYNMKNVMVTAIDADNVTCTLLATAAAATVFGYMYDASEVVVVTTGETV